MYLWGIFYRPCGIPSRRRIGKDGLIFRLVYFATVGEGGGLVLSKDTKIANTYSGRRQSIAGRGG